jgi:type IV fimbrial biogenesis protein FimT
LTNLHSHENFHPLFVITTTPPGMQDLIASRRLEGAATQLATDIQFVRTEAVARNQALRLSFHDHAAGSCYVIHSGAADDCSCAASGPAECRNKAREIKTVSLITRHGLSLEANVNSMLFDPQHGTSTPTGTLRVTGAHGRAVHHVVSVLGRVRSCSPQAAVPGYRMC